jgi:hypothetical protein
MTGRPPLVSPLTRNAILRRVATLTTDDLHRLDAAVRELAATKAGRHLEKGFLFAWWEGPRLRREEDDELEDLFGALLAALAGGLTGLDVERVGARLAPKPGLLDGLLQVFLAPRRDHQVQDTAIALIEDAVAPWDPRLAIVATWNMACAAVLRAHLPAATAGSLEAAWRRAIGDPPA